MDEFLIGFVLFILLGVGNVLGFISFFKMRTLREEVGLLKFKLAQQQKQVAKLFNASKDIASDASRQSQPSEKAQSSKTKDEELAAKSVYNKAAADSVIQPIPLSSEKAKATSTQAPKQETPRQTTHSTSFNIEKFLSGNGLLWLGAVVLALGGIFLAKYSIEAGLFPPGLRIILGSIFGIVLIVAGEYLYRNPKRFDINSPMISAALASGGVITLYAMAYVAFDFYDFVSPAVTFILMAVIATGAAWLSLRLGPMLAGIGIIGAYLVPMLVSTDSNNVLMLLIYVGLVSLSSVWVYQIVKRMWIWQITIFAHFTWFFVAVFTSIDQASALSGSTSYAHLSVLTAFVIASIYLFTLFPVMGWNLSQTLAKPLSIKEMLFPRKEQIGLVLSLFFIAFYALSLPFSSELYISLAAICALLMLLPSRHSAFDTWPFLALFATLFVYFLIPQNYDYQDNLFMFTGGFLFIQSATFIGIAYAVLMHILYSNRHAYLLLLAVLPLLLFGVSYATSDARAAQYLYPIFASELGLIALVFAFFATRVVQSYQKMAYLFVVNACVALTLTMLLSASVLTLAFAAQLTLMATLSRLYDLPLPNWLYKVAMVLVLLRLTFAPWLADYADEDIWGIHWTVVVYPIAFALLVWAYKQISDASLKSWFAGALVHLGALFITTETSYLLIGQYPSFSGMSFQVSTLLGVNYLIYATVLMWRRAKTSHPTFYLIYAIIIYTGSLLTLFIANTYYNPYLSVQDIGTIPAFNWLLLLWLLPVCIFVLSKRLNVIQVAYEKPLYILAVLFGFFFFNSIIRMAFNDNITLGIYDIGQAELYTYSIVYLLISIAAIVLAQNVESPQLLKAGFIVLALVVLKAFLIDMSSLEGLYRAISFIGLGLSLVGIGWLFQRLKKQGQSTILAVGAG